MPEVIRQVLTGLRVLVVLTALLGIGYPMLVLGLGHAFEHQRTGSLIISGDRVVGSSLIAQSFDGHELAGQPLDRNEWFQPRPSAVDYNAQGSGGSNLGPSNAKLATTVEQRRARVASREHVAPARVPPDALTASGSGLDPYISPAYAELQVPRVARERGLSEDQVRALVAQHLQGRILGFLGEPRVDVVDLDSALENLR